MTKAIPADFGNGTWTKAEEKARKEKGFTGIKRKNYLLIAATLEELFSQGKTSGLLDKVCNKILTFAENERM